MISYLGKDCEPGALVFYNRDQTTQYQQLSSFSGTQERNLLGRGGKEGQTKIEPNRAARPVSAWLVLREMRGPSKRGAY